MPTDKNTDTARFADTGWFEIFEAKNFGIKGNYTESDIKDMADAINSGKHKVPIIIGHDVDPFDKWNKPLPAELADGFLKEAVADGKILKAKASVSERVKGFWDDSRLLSWSPGIYKNFQGTGRKVVRHLASLGKTPPANKGLNYTPQFTFSEDNKNGEYIDFSETSDDGHPSPLPSIGDHNMTLEEALAENARLTKELDGRDAATFDEIKKENADNVVEIKKVRDERDAEKTRADKAEEALADTEQKAAFAEIERCKQEEIKKGLAKEHHEDYCALKAHELGMVDEGVATFAEGKTSKKSPTEIITESRDWKYVPLDEEGAAHIDGKDIDIATFDEKDLPAMQTKRLELTDKKLEEMKKTNEGATFAEAAQATQDKFPQLYPDM